MLDAEDILNGLVRGALSGRGKSWRRAGRAVRGSGLVNAQTLLAAAGVAWGLFETWQSQQGQGQVPPAGSTPTGSPPGSGPLATPPPLPGAAAAAPPAGEAGLPAPVLQLMRLMISAARADGELGSRRAGANPRRGPGGRRRGARRRGRSTPRGRSARSWPA